MKRVINVFEAFDGAVGTVIVPGQEHQLGNHKVSLPANVDEGELGFVVDGQLLYVNEEVGDTDSFEFDPNNLVLFKEEGYRGEGCYWGMYWDADKERLLGVDFVNDGLVYTLKA